MKQPGRRRRGARPRGTRKPAAPHWTRRLLSGLSLCLVMAWLGGFLWFLYVTYSPSTPPARADGIVVLTGGEDRLAAAFEMLDEGHARQLLISGVPPGVTLADLERSAQLSRPPPASHVTLGHRAQTTRGNARETAGWVARHDIRSLIVVTAGYHMPRALLEMSRAMPGVPLYPMRVQPRLIFDGTRPHVWSLLVGEYTKWLLAELRYGPVLSLFERNRLP